MLYVPCAKRNGLPLHSTQHTLTTGCLSHCGKAKIQTNQSNASYIYQNVRISILYCMNDSKVGTRVVICRVLYCLGGSIKCNLQS